MWCIEELLAVLGSIPRLDLRGPDNQSPMKQDNRDHWTLSSPVTSYICFKSPLRPLHLFQSHSDSIHMTKVGAFLDSSENLSEHLSEEVNWLFCRPLSALPFPQSPSSYSSAQSTQGNVVNFCYDRLRDNPTIAKHFVYLSHSHKSSRILKEKKKNILGWLVGV